MSQELITAIVVALVAAAPGLFALFHQRRLASATAADTLTGSAMRMVERHDKEIKELEDKNDHLEAELEVQAHAIENLTAKNLKLQVLISILTNQLRAAGFEPVVDPARIESIEVDELRLIAESLSNVERRRESLRRTQQLKRPTHE